MPEMRIKTLCEYRGKTRAPGDMVEIEAEHVDLLKIIGWADLPVAETATAAKAVKPAGRLGRIMQSQP